MFITTNVVPAQVEHTLTLSQEELEVVVAGFGLTDNINRQIRHAAKLQEKEGIVGATLALDANEQRHLYTLLARAAREGRKA